MNVVEIAWDRLIERRQWGVDEKVMMTGIRFGYSCRCDLHVVDSETDLDLGGDRRAVLEIDEIYPGLRGRRISRRSGLRTGFASSIHGNYQKNNRAEACKSIHEPLPSYASMRLEAQQAGRKLRSFGNPQV